MTKTALPKSEDYRTHKNRLLARIRHARGGNDPALLALLERQLAEHKRQKESPGTDARG